MFEAISNDHWFRSCNKLSLCECLWEKIFVNSFADFVILKTSTQNKFRFDSGEDILWRGLCGSDELFARYIKISESASLTQ